MARDPRPTPTSAPGRGVSAWRDGGLVILLCGATLLAYGPALSAGFIWNDSEYVTAPALRSLDGLARIWFEVGATEQYYPLLHSAFWLEHQLWGDAALGYHLANVLLHALAACLFAAVLRRLGRMGGAAPASPGSFGTGGTAWLAAFIFALHPVCVESVAWISEQKNTLSLVFYLLSAFVYLRFDEQRRGRDYALALGLFVLALLSKTVTATLPAALLVAIWWRRGRIEWRADVRPLVPWFGLAAGMGLFSAWVEHTFIGAHGAEFALTFGQRALLAGRIVWFYVGKLFWPAELIFIYPRWQVDPALAWWWWFSAGAILALAGLWGLRRRTRGPLAAALFFGGSLFPTLGFFNVYGFLYSFVADHWQYLPCLGLVALAAAGLGRLTAGRTPALRVGLPLLLVGVLAGLTFRQSRMYADMPTFYATTLAQNPACWMAHNNLGNLKRATGDFEGAIAHYKAALKIRPDLAKVQNNLGTALEELRRGADAIAHYERALALDPSYPEAHNNLGRILREAGRRDEALGHLHRAIQLDPAYLDARNNLGVVLRDAGRLPEALAQFERVARAQPGLASAHLNLALTLALLGREAEARESFRTARRLNPAIPDVLGK